MTSEQAIRRLARSDHYQTLFVLSKEMSNIRLFENDIDFTHLQIAFLKYLNFYYNLKTDIATGDVEEFVWEDDIYADSYMMYKNKKDKKEVKSAMKSGRDSNKEQVPISQWIFKSPKKES